MSEISQIQMHDLTAIKAMICFLLHIASYIPANILNCIPDVRGCVSSAAFWKKLPIIRNKILNKIVDLFGRFECSFVEGRGLLINGLEREITLAL